MTVTGYLSEHWGLIILLMGLAVVILSDTHLNRRILRHMVAVTAMLFIYSVTCYVETFLGNQSDYTPVRPFLSALNYSLIVFILTHLISTMYPKTNFMFWIPSLINAILCFVSLKTGIVFTISDTNHFVRGRLGYLTYFVCIFYLLYYIFKLIQNSKNRLEDYILPGFIIFISTLCLLMPIVVEDMALHWFNITIAIEVMLYYVYLLQQYTKRDSLTNLLNRQSYYSDAKKLMNSITAYITMDMDGLKKINDENGHAAGDVALKTLADCFWKSASTNQRVYRIGGDEYVILCSNSTEDEVKDLIMRIKEKVNSTAYSCSIGYAMKTEDSTLDSLYQQADANMYKEKKLYYEKKGISR